MRIHSRWELSDKAEEHKRGVRHCQPPPSESVSFHSPWLIPTAVWTWTSSWTLACDGSQLLLNTAERFTRRQHVLELLKPVLACNIFCRCINCEYKIMKENFLCHCCQKYWEELIDSNQDAKRLGFYEPWARHYLNYYKTQHDSCCRRRYLTSDGSNYLQDETQDHKKFV